MPMDFLSIAPISWLVLLKGCVRLMCTRTAARQGRCNYDSLQLLFWSCFFMVLFASYVLSYSGGDSVSGWRAGRASVRGRLMRLFTT